jgi:hypothetical protein
MAQVIEHLPSKVQQVLGPEFKFQLKKKYRVFSSSSKESLSYEFYFGLCLSEAFLWLLAYFVFMRWVDLSRTETAPETSIEGPDLSNTKPIKNKG